MTEKSRTSFRGGQNMEKANTYNKRGACADDNLYVCHLLSLRTLLREALPETWNAGGLGV